MDCLCHDLLTLVLMFTIPRDIEPQGRVNAARFLGRIQCVSKDFNAAVDELFQKKITSLTRRIAESRHMEISVSRAQNLDILPIDVSVRCKERVVSSSNNVEQKALFLSLEDLLTLLDDKRFEEFELRESLFVDADDDGSGELEFIFPNR